MPPRTPRTLLVGIGLSQLVAYGTTYYAMSPLAAAVAATFGLPDSWIFGALSVALLAGGLAGPQVGAWVDRIGAGKVMSLASVPVALCLAGMAVAPAPLVFAAALVLLQVGAAGMLYDAAFPGVAQVAGVAARRAITQVTLVAGLSSSLFWPLTAWLEAEIGWRSTLLALAGLTLCVCLPLNLALARWTGPRPAGESTSGGEGVLTGQRRRRGLVLMVAGFCLAGFVLSAILTNMVPLLRAAGIGDHAALVASLFGPAQIVVRLAEMLWGVRLGPIRVAVLSAAMLPLAALLLALGAPWPPAAIAFAVVLGTGSGMQSIVRGVLPLHLFGAAGYARLLGQASLARLVVTAAAPVLFALAMERAGPATALGGLVLIGAAGVVLLALLGRLLRPD